MRQTLLNLFKMSEIEVAEKRMIERGATVIRNIQFSSVQFNNLFILQIYAHDVHFKFECEILMNLLNLSYLNSRHAVPLSF